MKVFAMRPYLSYLPFLFSLACGGTPTPTPTPTPTQTPTQTQTQPVTDETRVKAFIAKIVAHDFDGALALANDKVRAGLPKEKLTEVWTAIETSAGAYKAIESIETKTVDTARIFIVKTTFERTSLILRIALDEKNLVAGFFVAPVEKPVTWSAPSYGNAASFDDKAVTIGTAPALPGTFSVPKNAKKYPAVVLVHGSGPNDQDETIGALKPFKDLAFGLASHGVAVLRYEKRTKVDPTGVTTQKEEVEDAAHAAIAFLRAQPDVDPNRIVLLGHSQGGYLAPRIAKADPAIKGLVILAGSTRPLEDSIIAQFKYFATLQPNDPKITEAIATAEKFKLAVTSATLKATDAVPSPFGASIPGAYFLDVRGYHPEKVAAALTIPMLVVNGERDYQVTIADDFSGWKTALAKKKTATLKTYPTLTHAFTLGSVPPTPSDYEKPGNVDAAVITDVAEWITKLK